MTTSDNINDFTVGLIIVSPQHNTITKDEKIVRLQPKVMAVLHYLSKHKDRVINNDELLEEVWEGRVVTNSSIQKSVNALRSAFTELDDSFNYVVYFSKRGYQLISPPTGKNDQNNTSRQISFSPFILVFISMLVLASLGYLFYATKAPGSTSSVIADNIQYIIPKFTQVKPFASNTGLEKIIEPHYNSERIALIKDETINSKQVKISRLYVQSTNGRKWQVSTARGEFVSISWSPSGRNLVVVDLHKNNANQAQSSDVSNNYYTFHIYTFDFKAEKVIEKNVLSHWQGSVSNVSWWDEATLEFTASQGSNSNRLRFRYGIAEQNLSTIKAVNAQGKLLNAYVFNKLTATLSLLGGNEIVEFLDVQQNTIGKWALPLKIISANWLSNGEGLIVLSQTNSLHILYKDGRFETIKYLPQISGIIKYASSSNKGNNLILTVGNIDDSAVTSSHNVGGFIYSAP